MHVLKEPLTLTEKRNREGIKIRIPGVAFSYRAPSFHFVSIDRRIRDFSLLVLRACGLHIKLAVPSSQVSTS